MAVEVSNAHYLIALALLFALNGSIGLAMCTVGCQSDYPLT